jgi:hypothetical protein
VEADPEDLRQDGRLVRARPKKPASKSWRRSESLGWLRTSIDTP